MKIKKSDTVKIICGKDKGKTGKVLKVFPQMSKLLIEGLNLYKKHVRPKRQGEKGQTVLVPRPINVSNVMLVCQNCNKTVRAGYRYENPEGLQRYVGAYRADKNKIRYCKKCSAALRG